MNIFDTMAAMQEQIFLYEIKELGNLMSSLVEQLDPLLSGLEPEKVNGINACLTQILLAIQNQDYLHLADLLEYELQPHLKQFLS